MFAVRRLEALVELAALRKSDLLQLMEELGIRPTPMFGLESVEPDRPKEEGLKPLASSAHQFV